ncbi:sensor histidine kinase [Candidatus Poribacteria bacterium]
MGITVLGVQKRRASRAYKMAEQIQAGKMVSLRQLVAGVAHQMNNPIGTLASNNDVSNRAIEKIKERIDERGSQEIKGDSQLTRAFAVLDRMKTGNQTASDGIARTVADLRSFVRLDEAEWQLADIHEAMDHVLGLMKSELSDRITVVKDYGDIPRVYCSPSSLNQVFMSMFRNACEAIDREGEIHLRTSVQGEHAIIEISDTGIGIPPENIDRIFDPGFTTKGVKVGVGLGLSICYQIIVDEHKGRIDVSSEPGKGATFTITLPRDYQD